MEAQHLFTDYKIYYRSEDPKFATKFMYINAKTDEEAMAKAQEFCGRHEFTLLHLHRVTVDTLFGGAKYNLGKRSY